MHERNDFLDVREFHVKFGVPIDHPGVPVHWMDDSMFRFRQKFLTEELSEYADAVNRSDLVKTVDSLIDFVYVAMGTALFMGAGEVYVEWPKFAPVRQRVLRNRWNMPHTSAPIFLTGQLNLEMHDRMARLIGQFCLNHVSKSKGEWAHDVTVGILKMAVLEAYLTAAMMNVPWVECWQHVHDANMKKIRAASDGSDSTRKSPWDVVKPVGWLPPDPSIRLELEMRGAIIHTQGGV